MSMPLPSVVRVASALICLTLTPLLGFGQVRDSRDWKRLRAGDLKIVGNAGAAELQRGNQHRTIPHTLSRVYPGMKRSFSVPTVLVVFTNEADFARFKPRDEHGRIQQNVGGYFIFALIDL